MYRNCIIGFHFLILFLPYTHAQELNAPARRIPRKEEIQILKNYRDTIEKQLNMPANKSQVNQNQLVLKYVDLFSYFEEAYKVVLFNQKNIRYILGNPDTTFALSQYNPIQVWQYGEVISKYSNVGKRTRYRFYFKAGQLMSVTRIEED